MATVETTLRNLKREARRSAEWRGHELGNFRPATFRNDQRVADCRNCDASVVVDARPAPNGIDIAGDAVAINCTKGIDA